MKELSIEEKAKRYDEAIKKAEVLYKTAEPMSGCNVLLETVFPELAEPDDERIRKALINGFNKLDKSAVWYNGITNAQILDWIEKQVNHANFRNKIQIGDKVTRNKDGVLVNLSQLKRVAKKYENQYQTFTKKDVDDAYLKGICDAKHELENQGEKKPVNKVEPKFHKGDIIKPKDGGHEPWQIIQVDIFDKKYRFKDGYVVHFSQEDAYELVEQKPTDEEIKELLRTEYEKGRADAIAEMQKSWSEEDEEMLKMVIKSCEQQGSEYAYYWLESLKDRVQPKQEWSEKDNQYLCGLIGLIEQSKAGLPITLKGKAADNCIDWLKSLRPQWKPSEEQIEILDIVLTNESMDDNVARILRELREQLKKLKE